VTRRRTLRLAAFGSAAVVVVALVVVVVLVTTFVRRPLPERGGEVSLPGLNNSVQVIRDDRGVPQIYADDATDLMRVQGYIHAQDRFFEMDLRRHITAGRLSELVGANDEALRSDAVIRTLGWRRVAQQELELVTPEVRSYLEAYADGVNDYTRDKSWSELSVNYTLLGRRNPLGRIEPWTPVDSLAWIKAMAWDLRSNYNEELERARSITTVKGVQQIAKLYPEYPYSEHPPIIPSAGNADGDTAAEGDANGGAAGGSGDGTGAGTEGSAGGGTPSLAAANVRRAALGASQAGGPAPAAGRDDDAADEAADDAAREAGAAAGDAVGRATAAIQGPAAGGPAMPTGSLEEALANEHAQRAFKATAVAIDSIPELLGRGDGIGSNSWVVSGELTDTGKPLLANDPHLETSMPGIWYQVGLHCRTVNERCPFDVAGFGFSGMPGVVIGHNQRIAWGLTNLYPDVTDFYLERVNSNNQVESGGAMKPMTTRQETIEVAGGSPVTITVRQTPHGPLLSDVVEGVAEAGGSAPVPGEELDRQTTYGVSLAWTALTPGQAMDSIIAMNRATNFDEFRQAARLLDAPAQSMIYADVDGNIGYQAPGRIPVRGPGREEIPDPPNVKIPSDGTWPQPGWDAAYDWRGTLPFEQLPWVENPPEGYIVAANQAVTGPDGVRLTSDWDYGYRSDRIDQLIGTARSQGRKLTLDDMRAVQTDTRNGMAEILVPTLLRVYDSGTSRDAFTSEAVDLLRGWDYTQPTDSAAAAYFNVVWATIVRLTFDEMPEGFRPDGGDRWFQVVRNLMGNTDDLWWDDQTTAGVREARDEIFRRALAGARLQLTSTLGKDPDRWQWGRLHRVRLLETPIGLDSPGLVKRLVNRGPYEAPGGSAVVNAFSWDASSGTFDVTAAPSMRMIVDLANFDRSRWVNQTGISGHPADSHYDDQIEAWLEGEDFEWPYTRDAVSEAKDDEQTFNPDSS
jgi:penicillin amidase